MKKSIITFICDFIIICCCEMIIYFIVKDYLDAYNYYLNLYNTLENSEELLQIAYSYSSYIWLSVGVGSAVAIILLSITNLLFKNNSIKHTIVFILSSIIAIGFVALLVFVAVKSVSFHKIGVILICIIITILVSGYCICSYINHKKV